MATKKKIKKETPIPLKISKKPLKEIKASAKESKTSAKDSDTLFIGIDFGTNHTAISTSDGKKKSILSLIGFPKDAVASRFLQKERLFGDEALKHRAALNMFKPIESGVLKNQRDDLLAAKGLLEYVLGLVDANRNIKKYAIIGVPSQANS